MRLIFKTSLLLAGIGSAASAQTTINGASLAQRSSGVASSATSWMLGTNGYLGTYITLANAGTVTLAYASRARA